MALAWKAGWVNSPQGFESPILRQPERRRTHVRRRRGSGAGWVRRRPVPGASPGRRRPRVRRYWSRSCGIASPRPGNRLQRAGRASWSSSLASSAPTHRWMPWPNATWGRRLAAGSIRSGVPTDARVASRDAQRAEHDVVSSDRRIRRGRGRAARSAGRPPGRRPGSAAARRRTASTKDSSSASRAKSCAVLLEQAQGRPAPACWPWTRAHRSAGRQRPRQARGHVSSEPWSATSSLSKSGPGLDPSARDEVLEVGERLGDSPQGKTSAPSTTSNLRDAQPLEVVALGVGHTEQLADGEARDRQREVLHEVGLAVTLRWPGSRRVEALDRRSPRRSKGTVPSAAAR